MTGIASSHGAVTEFTDQRDPRYKYQLILESSILRAEEDHFPTEMLFCGATACSLSCSTHAQIPQRLHTQFKGPQRRRQRRP